jgi:hypothetical protein
MITFCPGRAYVALSICLALATRITTAAPLFEVVEIPVIDGTPGSFDDVSSGECVNNNGTVAGVSSPTVGGGTYGITFQNGVSSYLGSRSEALRRFPGWITQNGLIAGSETSRGFIFQGNAFTFLAANTRLNAINDNGLFGGSSGGFAAYGSGTTLSLILPVTGQPAFQGGVVWALNNAGQMVGEFNLAPAGAFKTGFYRSGGDPILITPPANYDSALPADINESGAFIGALYGTISNGNAFYCPGIGQPLQIIPNFRATSLSDDGTIVGGTRMYQNGTIYQLSQIVNGTGNGWSFVSIFDISPNGRYITGMGRRNGFQRGFLLRPVSIAPPVITATARNGAVFTIDFTGTPGQTGWKIKGSTNLESFPADLTSSSTITEPIAGNYRAQVTVPGAPASYFLRLTTP